MENRSLNLQVSELILAVCWLPPHDAFPSWLRKKEFYSVTRTCDELSIICSEDQVPLHVKAERDWRMIKVSGPLDFTMTGVLASLLHPLAEAGIPVFTLSTFETDYLLLKEEHLDRATRILGRKHKVEHSGS